MRLFNGSIVQSFQYLDRKIARENERILIPDSSPLPRHFWARRIHSLLGIVPLGAFLLCLIYTYSKSLGPNGVVAFNQALQDRSKIPFLFVLEIFFIYLPLLYHALYGFVILYLGKSNVVRYPHGANVRFLLQRLTGVIALFFIGYHVYATRLTSLVTGSPVDYLWIVRLFEQSWTGWFYLIGSVALSFHLANGIWNFLIVWGITVSKRSQKISLSFCMALFSILTVVNALIIANFTYYQNPAPFWIAGILKFVRTVLFG